MGLGGGAGGGRARGVECQRRLVRGRAGVAPAPPHGDGEDPAHEPLPGLALQAPVHLGLLPGVEAARLLHLEPVPRHGACRGVLCCVVVCLWCDVVSCIVSCRVVSCRVVSCRVVSCRVVSCRVVSCRVVSCRVVSCRVVSCRVVSCRVVSCRVVSCRVVSQRGSLRPLNFGFSLSNLFFIF